MFNTKILFIFFLGIQALAKASELSLPASDRLSLYTYIGWTPPGIMEVKRVQDIIL